MTYHIAGLDPERFSDRDALAATGAIRMIADRDQAFPCRVSLEFATPGEPVWLINFLSADVPTPFRATHAIYVREGATAALVRHDAVPPMIAGRTTSLRGFDTAGMLRHAAVALAQETDAGIRGLLADEEIAYVDVHNAAYGCFLARAERD